MLHLWIGQIALNIHKLYLRDASGLCSDYYTYSFNKPTHLTHSAVLRRIVSGQVQVILVLLFMCILNSYILHRFVQLLTKFIIIVFSG
jgi:hypothetical protein